MESLVNSQSENKKQLRDQKLQDKLMPWVHVCYAYVAYFFYFGMRADLTAAPIQIKDLWNDRTFQSVAFLSASVAAAAGMIIISYIYKNKSVSPIPIMGMFFDSEMYRIRYYKPYIFTALFVVVTEIVILVI